MARSKNGKTATRILTDDQHADYVPWFDNHKRIRELITELEELSLTIAENGRPQNRSIRLQIVWLTARLTCGQPANRPLLAQVTPKRETLSSSEA